MDHIDVVPHMDRWPSFHNGVAAGLRIPTGMTTNIRASKLLSWHDPFLIHHSHFCASNYPIISPHLHCVETLKKVKFHIGKIAEI